MRPELLPTPDDPRLAALWREAYTRIESADPPVEVAAWLSAESGLAVSPTELMSDFGSTNAEDAARARGYPELPTVTLTRGELVEIAELLLPGSDRWDLKNEAWWTALFDRNVPRPHASNAIYHPPAGVDLSTAEALVDYALSYQPTAL